MSEVENWWKIVDRNWEDLKSLIETFKTVNNIPAMQITAERAESIRQCVAKDVEEDYETLKVNRDVKLSEVFEKIYWNVPESTLCWNYPGFGVLCDLCSESYILYTEKENETTTTE